MRFRSFALKAALVGIFLTAFPPLVLNSVAAARIESGLIEKLESGKLDHFVVEFGARADLRDASKTKNHAERGRRVHRELTSTSNSSQAGARKTVSSTKGARAESHWIANEMIVYGDAALAKKLSAEKGVTLIRSEKTYPLIKPVSAKAAILAAAGDPEWGVDKIGADEVWANGVLGSGIVVANVDTGVDFTHDALVGQYRGNLGNDGFDHNFNWWDPTGICGDTPCDNAGHGTHTMGTMVGGDGPGPFTPDIGVAPGATWIAAKGCEDFGCSESALISSGEFILAPTDLLGGNADPAKRPDIVNNSWGGGPGDLFYLAVVQAWRAAGIIPVFASGNPGPDCGAGGSPGDYLESFSAGATDINDQIADFSGRGPSSLGKINPDVSAPGVDVISSVPGGGYEAFSGTSMATPHTAGALALVLSAEPALIGNVQAATDAVRGTALDIIDESCGGDEDGDPNNVYGDGRIDAQAAVDLVATGGTLAGTITDSGTGAPIAGARITADDGNRQYNATADTAGKYELFLAAGTYAVSAESFGYETAIVPGVEIVTDQTTTQNFALQALPRAVVSGVVTAAEDGSPIAGARVLAVGTPVPPAVTNAAGKYHLTLPIGDYTLRASAGGCTEVAFVDITLGLQGLTQNFSLFRKLDDFGHACSAIPFRWAKALGQTALFGDEFVGRLTMPFSFPFYGAEYSQFFISDNGYINFLAPDQFNPFPVAIPTPEPPNAAVYPMWQGLFLDEESSISYGATGNSPQRQFVLEYKQVRVGFSAFSCETACTELTLPRLDFQVKLWEDGKIDMLYRGVPANPGDGRNAVIGIENADGTDAFLFSAFEPVITPNSAFRYEVVPTGVVSGTVTDANTGGPIPGAEVLASPGGRTAVTDADGHYTLRLLPGTYTLTATALNYETAQVSGISLQADEEITQDFALKAAIAEITPTSIAEQTAFGETTTVPLTISNPGTAPLNWQLKERAIGETPPELPPVPEITRQNKWAKPDYPKNMTKAKTSALPPEALQPVIDDPAGDSGGSVDITTVRGASDASDMSIEISFTDTTPLGQVVGYVQFDTDQDPGTGFPPEAQFGLPEQDIGIDYFADLFAIHEPDPIVGIWNEFFELVAIVPVKVENQKIAFDVPLSAFGDDDGAMDVVMNVGTIGPEDWAPDAGHGTIGNFVDAPWMSAQPAEGTVPPGGSTQVELTLGGPDVPAGLYEGQLVLLSNAPLQPSIAVDVTLEVALPGDFGGVQGTVTDAHSDAPLAGALVTVSAERDGEPFVVTRTTAADGTYLMFVPEGTWPIEFSLEGYVPSSGTVDVVGGQTRQNVNAALHRVQPHAAFNGEPLDIQLEPGGTASRTVTLSNPGGHADLTFSTGEVDVAGAGAAATAARKAPSGNAANARTSKGLFGKAPTPKKGTMSPGDVLTSWPTGMTLPWGVNYRGTVTISDPADLIDVEFSTAGERLGEFGVPWAGDWAADMAWDAARGLIWQVNVGGDNGLYGLDPADGTVKETITGSPWTGISQRGVAYDPATDTFYVGGWNEGIVYHVAGLSWPTPGETLDSCSPPDPNISGLAWNPSFGLLWEATNSDFDTIWLIDPVTCDATQSLPHPTPGFNGAGLEMDVVGNLWTVSQASGDAFLIESGLPNFSDVGWLSVSPAEGTVAPDAEQDLEIAVDAAGLEPGVYQALVVVQTNDPANATFVVPVNLLVSQYIENVNSGGGAFTAGDGTAYVADQAFDTGGFGYVGGTEESTTEPIEGTDDDALYQNVRSGMEAYRFTVPEGHYRVTLRFAELSADADFERVFDVTAEGAVVVDNLDIFHAAGGQFRALDRTFEVDVTDGVLDLGFVQALGAAPIVNAIQVAWVPPEG